MSAVRSVVILFIISVQAVLAQPVLDVVGDLPVVHLLEHEVAVALSVDVGDICSLRA